MTGKGGHLTHPGPRIETTKAMHPHLLGSVLAEAAAVHRGFENWLPLLVAIATGRLRGRPAALVMQVRHGPTLRTPEGDRSWWTAVECFGLVCYPLASAEFPPAPVVVDVGANIGCFTLALLSVRAQAHVAAYDASRSAIAALTANIAANHVQSRVTVHHGAVTGHPEPRTVWLNEHLGALCTSSLLDENDARGSTDRVEVPAVTLGAILSAYPGDVDLVKMDVEGGEYAAIEVTPMPLLAKVRRMVIEYHDVSGRDVGELAQRLEAAGLVWERQQHGGLPRHGLAWWARPAED